jgi:N-acetylneuraminate lyase
MDKEGKLNLALIPAYYRFLKYNGMAGAFICGSTGEGVSLEIPEKKALCRAWADATRSDPDFKLILFVGDTCIATCKALSQYARQEGLYGISFTAPFYFKPATVEILADCCREVAAAVPDMRFYYYHIPSFTGVDFPMIDLLRSADGKIPNFSGIKYTYWNFMDFLSCLHFSNGKYDMLWGRDENLLAALALGAEGAVGSTYNYAAPLYRALMEAFHDNDLEKARALQQQAIDMIALVPKYGGMAAGKAYMKLSGLDCGGCRLPAKDMDEEGFESFRREAARIDFGSLCSVVPA